MSHDVLLVFLVNVRRGRNSRRAQKIQRARETLFYLTIKQDRTSWIPDQCLRERPPGLLDMYPSQQTNQKIARSLDWIVHLRSDVCVRIWRGVRVRSSFSSCVCFPAAVASAARVRFLRRGDVLPRGDARELELRGGKDAQRSSSRAQEAIDAEKANRRTSCAMLTSSETRKKETNQQRHCVLWFGSTTEATSRWLSLIHISEPTRRS